MLNVNFTDLTFNVLDVCKRTIKLHYLCYEKTCMKKWGLIKYTEKDRSKEYPAELGWEY